MGRSCVENGCWVDGWEVVFSWFEGAKLPDGNSLTTLTAELDKIGHYMGYHVELETPRGEVIVHHVSTSEISYWPVWYLSSHAFRLDG